MAGESGVNRTGKPGESADAGRGAQSAEKEPGGQSTGEAVAAVRRALRGDKAREPEADRRKGNDALWAQAAKWKAASDARQARGRGAPGGSGPGGREPLKPWFTESADEELWLSSEGTGDPWFWPEER